LHYLFAEKNFNLPSPPLGIQENWPLPIILIFIHDSKCWGPRSKDNELADHRTWVQKTSCTLAVWKHFGGGVQPYVS